MASPLFDSHMHTPLCGHATGTPREYAQAALDAGLDGVCFTDHAPMPAWYDAPWRMRPSPLRALGRAGRGLLAPGPG